LASIGFHWLWVALDWIAAFKLWRWSKNQEKDGILDGSQLRQSLVFLGFLVALA
jgi:hypothetical protein